MHEVSQGLKTSQPLSRVVVHPHLLLPGATSKKVESGRRAHVTVSGLALDSTW